MKSEPKRMGSLGGVLKTSGTGVCEVSSATLNQFNLVVGIHVLALEAWILPFQGFFSLAPSPSPGGSKRVSNMKSMQPQCQWKALLAQRVP